MTLPTPVVEGLKELCRVSLIAAVPLLISGLETGLIDWRMVGIASIIAVLKALDKYLHKSGIEKGLTRF